MCAEPLVTQQDATCGACLQRLPHFDACFAPYRYSYPLDHMIRALKYAGAVAYGRVLGDLFAQRASHRALPELVVPVPLGRARFAARGYNQALELAMRVSQQLAVPLCTDVLIRTRDTLEQAGLDRKARRKNLRGAFALARALSASSVAVFDDVVTTGSTANEIARLLKRAGIGRVEIWAIARAARVR